MICIGVIGVLGHDSALLRLYWAGDNLGNMICVCMCGVSMFVIWALGHLSLVEFKTNIIYCYHVFN